MNDSNRGTAVLVLGMLAGLAGCGEPEPLPAPDSFDVTCTVKLNGKPLSNAMIGFQGKDVDAFEQELDQAGKTPAGLKMVPGVYQVRVRSKPVPDGAAASGAAQTIPQKLQSYETSGQTISVKTAPNSFQIDL